MKSKFAVIFDMDGVIVDNYPFHNKAWKLFCDRHGLGFGQAFRSSIFGGTNKDHLEAFFGHPLGEAEVMKYEEEKERIYRELYREHIKPVKGLTGFLQLLTGKGVPVALATSSPPVNVGFVMEATGVGHHFRAMVDASGVMHGKPHPEIYLKAAALLGVEAARCLVFEDSRNGIASARKAGMKVVALSTTHAAGELEDVDLIIQDFTAIAWDDLISLMNPAV